MKILVTGHKGFIGRHAVSHFTGKGHDVTGVDYRLGSFDTPELYGCQDFFNHNSPDDFDVVLHFAANVGGRVAIDNKAIWVAETLASDSAMFSWVEQAENKPYVIYPSSSAAYSQGIQNNLASPSRESSIDLSANFIGVPDAMYGWVKLTGEVLASYSSADVGIIRPFSGYGTDQGEEYPFGAFLKRALAKEDPFYIWGTGEQVRDWIHVDDIMNALEVLIDQRFTGPVNLATGRATTFLELAKMFTDAVGYSPEFVTLPDKPAGVKYRYGDTEKFFSLYTPQISIEEGIDRAVKEFI